MFSVLLTVELPQKISQAGRQAGRQRRGCVFSDRLFTSESGELLGPLLEPPFRKLSVIMSNQLKRVYDITVFPRKDNSLTMSSINRQEEKRVPSCTHTDVITI
jgi:hypothetical protein